MDKEYCIYAHINKINNKIYIGQTRNYERRCLPSNYKGCQKFYYAIQKYGWDNFNHIILIDNLTIDEANLLEEELIKKYNTVEEGYNLKSGGLNNIYSEESRQKMRAAKEIKPIICIETGIIYKSGREIERQFGYAEANISACCLHKLHSAYGYQWEFYEPGKIYSKRIDKRKKAVRCIELNRIFDSASDAARELSLQRPNISRCCEGKMHTTGGYHWEFVTKEEN